MEHLSGYGGCDKEKLRLLAFGCNLYGQLTDDPDWSIETNWKTTEVDTDWFKNGNTDRNDTPAEPIREPSLFTSVDTPTVVMTARESMRVLYVGSHSICVERDGNIYLRGLLSTYAPGNSRKTRELAVPLPPGVQTCNVTKAFGTRWAFLGLILSDGSVYTFSLTDWSFTILRCAATENPVDDIQINRLGDICFLYSPFSEETRAGGSIIRIYPPLPSITKHLYDASLQSLITGSISPISTFHLKTDYPSEGVSKKVIFKSISSTSTGFVALTSNGNIYTYGDQRFNSLGRPPDAVITSIAGANAQGWGQVTALEGIVINQIGANPGGHVQGALAEDGTVYIWGGDGTENINTSLEPRSKGGEEDEEVVMVDIVHPHGSEPVGFDGVYVGEDYVVLAEEESRYLWVSGGSDMGQTGFGSDYRCLPTALGVDEEIKKRKGVWRRLDLGMIEGRWRITKVDCGSGYNLVLLDSNISA
ncbi:hypothetical protein TWF481_006654 [Arthrobotrys musiformis]|uniref:Uncharacterized protein n=1 Tax=Arthrobotrys musiformis TaxID=47236 RepID=A0AAV9WAM3_9PEZI